MDYCGGSDPREESKSGSEYKGSEAEEILMVQSIR